MLAFKPKLRNASFHRHRDLLSRFNSMTSLKYTPAFPFSGICNLSVFSITVVRGGKQPVISHVYFMRNIFSRRESLLNLVSGTSQAAHYMVSLTLSPRVASAI